MTNVPLATQIYRNFRQWLRTTQIIWRDLHTTSMVPVWDEAIVRDDTLVGGRSFGQIAYQLLIDCYPGLKLKWRKNQLELLDRRPPKLFTGYYKGEIWTVDLKRAYLQIYSKLYLSGEWPHKKLKYPMLPIALSAQDYPKEVGNAVVGVCRSTRNKWCKGTEVWYVLKKNNYLSPVLWAQIQAILNSLAIEAENRGAIYINTDGYAFTSVRQQMSFASYLWSMGFKAKLEDGEGEILGINSLSFKETDNREKSGLVRHIETENENLLEWWKGL